MRNCNPLRKTELAYAKYGAEALVTNQISPTSFIPS
jgi:hypothetical protein